MPPEDATLVENYELERQRDQDRFYKERGPKFVYKGLYENEAAVRKYCGTPSPVPVASPSEPVANGAVVLEEEAAKQEYVWPADCYERLHKIFWSRLKLNYTKTDWGEVALWCDAYPDKCDAPKKIESMVEMSNRKHASAALDASQADKLKRLQETLEFGDQDCVVNVFGIGTTSFASETTGSTTHYYGSDESRSHTDGQSTTSNWGRAGLKCRSKSRE